MAADTDKSERFRDTLLERILVSRWTAGMGGAAVFGAMFAAAFGAGLTGLAGLFHELGLLNAVPWALCSLISGVSGLGLGLVAGRIKARTTDEIGRSGAEPWRQRRARLALQRGELVDDAEANRLAAVQAQKHLRASPKSRSRRAIRGAQATQAVVASMQLLLLLPAVSEGSVPRMFLHGGLAVALLLLATVVLPAQYRIQRRSERVAALYAVENLHRRNLDPASEHRTI